MVYTMDDFLNSSLDLYRDLFPNAPKMNSVSALKVQCPCVPEDHQFAPAAVGNSEEEVDLFASGAVPVESGDFPVTV